MSNAAVPSRSLHHVPFKSCQRTNAVRSDTAAENEQHLAASVDPVSRTSRPTLALRTRFSSARASERPHLSPSATPRQVGRHRASGISARRDPCCSTTRKASLARRYVAEAAKSLSSSSQADHPRLDFAPLGPPTEVNSEDRVLGNVYF